MPQGCALHSTNPHQVLTMLDAAGEAAVPHRAWLCLSLHPGTGLHVRENPRLRVCCAQTAPGVGAELDWPVTAPMQHLQVTDT